jgi:hypothetical protein
MAKIKNLLKVSGVPEARVTVASGESDDKIRQVTLTMSALDSFDIPSVIASLRLSVDEARDLARRILACTVTDDDLRSLRSYATKPGGLIRDESEDAALVVMCDKALAGDIEARASIADATPHNT